MTSYQPDSETVAPSSNELIEETSGINHVELIQTVIASLDQDESAMVSQTQERYLWKFKYGSVEVFVQLTGLSDDDILTVWSSVLQLPAKDEARLMRQLLAKNWSDTFEACFGIFSDQVVVLSTRTLAELSPGEVSRIITVVATIADENDEALQSEFGQ